MPSSSLASSQLPVSRHGIVGVDELAIAAPLPPPPSNIDIDSLVQALQTLRAFEFPSNCMIAFLRYCVDFYIQHEWRDVKIEATLTTSVLLSRLIGKLNMQESRSLVTIIGNALHKLLICAITDYEPDVRYHVLNALDQDSAFDKLVSLPENLNILFLCVRDERAEIRELSASMISRLSASNSAYILPFIRKILMQLLTEVDVYPDVGQREKSVRLMGHLLCHAPRLVNLYIKPLLDCLNSKIDEYRHNIPFGSSIVTVVGQLASQSSAETTEYFDSIIPFLIDSMQDFYYLQLKHTSLWALGQIVANTGYVIAPYKKYPNLLEILLGFLQTETSTQIRRETIRILGLLGAIDPFEYKSTLLKSRRDEIAAVAASAAASQQQLALQKQQHQLQLQLQQQQQQQQHGNGAGAAAGVGGDLVNQAAAINNDVNLQPGATAMAQLAAVAANMANNNTGGGGNNEQGGGGGGGGGGGSLDPIEMLIAMNGNNSLDEYYPALAIHLMMKTIKTSVSVGVRKDAIQALVFAMRTLDNRCVNYVELVIPPFLELIRTKNENLVIDLLVQLGFLVSYIKRHIEPYLPAIFGLVEHYWTMGNGSNADNAVSGVGGGVGGGGGMGASIGGASMVGGGGGGGGAGGGAAASGASKPQPKMVVALIDLVHALANVMDAAEFKRYLPKMLPLLLKQLQADMDDEESTCTLAAKVLNLLRSCTTCLDSYVHLILSQFADYLARRNADARKPHALVKRDILYTIYVFARQITLSDNCAILFQSFRKLLEQHADSLPPPTAPLVAIAEHPHIHQPAILSITHLLFSKVHISTPLSFD